ncbi:hypothetical protein FK515_28650 [Klebsiella pneumoniae]|nr:hypothetical protein [Klebsiella pneumoniae]
MLGHLPTKVIQRILHQGAHAIRRQFQLPISQARAVVPACPACQAAKLNQPLYYPGINPGGMLRTRYGKWISQSTCHLAVSNTFMLRSTLAPELSSRVHSRGPRRRNPSCT